MIAFGKARPAPELRRAALEKLVEKFFPPEAVEMGKAGIVNQEADTAVYEITIEHLTAKVVDKPGK